MDTKQKVLFVLCCVISILITIFASLIASVNFKREQYHKNPYYWCDATWECCASENCIGTKDAKASGLNTYYPSDLFVEGSAYHQNCILPVQNAVQNFSGDTGSNFNLGTLYGPGGSGTPPSYFGPGCTGPGGVGKCADPAYNPQVAPSCTYSSIDAPLLQSKIDGILPGPGKNTLNGSNIDKNKIGTSRSLNTTGWTNTNVPSPAKNLQSVNINNTMVSWNPDTQTSISNFTCPMTNPNVNKTTSTQSYNANNVLRTDLYSTT